MKTGSYMRKVASERELLKISKKLERADFRSQEKGLLTELHEIVSRISRHIMEEIEIRSGTQLHRTLKVNLMIPQ
jgi:hypothetical protein